MAKYTGIHRFSIPWKYYRNFLLNYTNTFDKVGKFRNMYNAQVIEGYQTILVYI